MTASANREPEQLTLDLPHRQALGAEDFLVSSSNRAGVDLVDQWPDWSLPAAIVAGPARSGKSHLVNVWQLRSGAAIISARNLDDRSVAHFEQSPALAIEDIDRSVANERVLFHLLNLAREKKRSILLTTRTLPGDIAVTLPDLRSRLRAAPLVRIEPADEALLKAVLVKLFNDRQLIIEPHVINHLALHMDRSIGTAEKVVAAADRLALALGRRVTRTLAAEALRSVAESREAD